MKHLSAIIFGVVLACVEAAPVEGQTLGQGGYYYFSGYSTPYTRTWIATYAGGYYGGCYYASQGYWQYAPVYVAPVATTYADAKPIDVKAALIGLAKYQLEAKELREGLLALGLSNPQPQYPVAYAGYGGSYITTASSYANSYPISASTVYGFNPTLLTYNQQAPQRDNTDLVAQLSGQALASGNDLGGKLSGIVQQQQANKAANDRDLIRLETLKHTLLSIGSNSATLQSGSSITVKPAAQSSLNVKPPAPGADDNLDSAILNAWVTLADTKCASCHYKDKDGKGTIKGNFDLMNYLAMSDAEKAARVYSRIDPAAPDKDRMPQKADGTPGIPLTPAEVDLFKRVRPLGKRTLQ